MTDQPQTTSEALDNLRTAVSELGREIARTSEGKAVSRACDWILRPGLPNRLALNVLIAVVSVYVAASIVLTFHW